MKKVQSNIVVEEINNNFDTVKEITSSRALTIRLGTYGEGRFEYGFAVEIPDNISMTGIIDI